MAHGGNSHQRRKARRLESRRRISWRETAIRLWGYVPRSATEVAILNGAQWGRTACFDRCRLPVMKDGYSVESYLSNIYRLADELRRCSNVEMWTTSSDGSGVEVMRRMDALWHNRTDQEVPAGTLVLWDEMTPSPTYGQVEMQRRIADLHIWGRPDMVLLDNGQVEMVDVKLSQGQETRDE